MSSLDKRHFKDLYPEIYKLLNKKIIDTGNFPGPGFYTSKNKNFILFYHQDKPFGCFSNFSPHPVNIFGIDFPTSEHAFQAIKSEDPNEQILVAKAKTPAQAFILGKKVKLRYNWEENKDKFMYQIVKAKFTQNKEIGELLLKTNDTILIEHTKNDRYWADNNDGTGYNMLGIILMKVRHDLLQENQQESTRK